MAKTEIGYPKSANPHTVTIGSVVRMKETYPIYDLESQSKMNAIRNHLSLYKNLFPVEKNRLHKFSNRHHSMFTAMPAVRSILDEQYDAGRRTRIARIRRILMLPRTINCRS